MWQGHLAAQNQKQIAEYHSQVPASDPFPIPQTSSAIPGKTLPWGTLWNATTVPGSKSLCFYKTGSSNQWISKAMLSVVNPCDTCWNSGHHSAVCRSTCIRTLGPHGSPQVLSIVRLSLARLGHLHSLQTKSTRSKWVWCSNSPVLYQLFILKCIYNFSAIFPQIANSFCQYLLPSFSIKSSKRIIEPQVIAMYLEIIHCSNLQCHDSSVITICFIVQ